MRIFGKTGLFGADRRGLGRALAVRGVRGGAAKRGKTGGEQWDKSAKPMGLCPIALFSRVFGLSTLVFRRFINGTENRFTTKSKQRKKSSGSALGFSVLGGAAFCCGAAVVIRPVNRFFFPFDVLSIFEMNEVKNVLLLLLRQETIHRNQISLFIFQRRAVTGQSLRLLELLDLRAFLSTWSYLCLERSKNQIVERYIQIF